MLDFDAVIQWFWLRAVKAVNWDHPRYDEKALEAINREGIPNRRDAIRDWLQAYRVLRVRGIATQRNEIADAILKWADARDRERNLETPTELSAAHKELTGSVLDAYLRSSENQSREFTSLTSKALWLCYPEKVPMFDG